MASEVSGISGSAFGALGAVAQGQAQGTALDRAAQIERNNAALDLQTGQVNAQAEQVRAAKKMGAIQTGYSASGVTLDSGSALSVLGESAANAELDKQNILHGAQVRAVNYDNQAAMDEAGASSARSAGYLNAFASVFMGGSKVFGQSAGVSPGNYRATTGNAGLSGGEDVEGGAVGEDGALDSSAEEGMGASSEEAAIAF